jgi:hypothetical protein
MFAIKTYGARMNPFDVEFDVNIDVNGDGVPDYIVFNADNGALSAGAANGQNIAFIFDVAHKAISAFFFTDASADSSTMILKAPLAAIGLGTPHKFNLWVNAFSNVDGLSNGQYVIDRAPDAGSVSFDPTQVGYTPSAYTFANVAQGASQTVGITRASSGDTELGMMAFYRDNVPGAGDADLEVTYDGLCTLSHEYMDPHSNGASALCSQLANRDPHQFDTVVKAFSNNQLTQGQADVLTSLAGTL